MNFPNYPQLSSNSAALADTMLSAANTLNASAATPSMATLARHSQAPAHPLPLSAIAKQLTAFLFGESSLSSFLQQYGPLMLVFTGGAAVASGLYHFFQEHKQNRAKVQLAIFHVVRMVENLPDWQAQMRNPHELVAQMDTEVTQMIDLHLTKTEAESALLQLKRKIWAVLDENMEMEKRRKKESETAEGYESTVMGHFARASEDHTQASYQGEIPQIIIHSPSSPPLAEVDIQTQLLEKEQSPDVDMLDFDDQSAVQQPPPSVVRDTYTSPTQVPQSPSPQSRNLFTSPTQRLPSTQSHSNCMYSSSSSSDSEPLTPTPAPRPRDPAPQASATGYGFTYNDNELYSSPSPTRSSSSTKILPTERQPSQLQQPLKTKKPMSMLQPATLRAFDPDSIGNRPYVSPVLSRSRNTNTPCTIDIEAPPVSTTIQSYEENIGRKTTFTREEMIPQKSPLPGTTEYWLTKNKPVHKNAVDARQELRLYKNHLKADVEIERVQQEPIESLTPVSPREMGCDKEWPPLILVYSDSDEDEMVERSTAPSPEQGRFAPIAPIDCPPAAPLISPFLPSPPSDAHTHEVSSPVHGTDTSSPRSEVQTPVLAIQHVVPQASQKPSPTRTPLGSMVRSSPVVLDKASPRTDTSSPPKRKRGRPRKGAGKPQTPCRVRTPGTRKSARQSAFKGMYGK